MAPRRLKSAILGLLAAFLWPSMGHSDCDPTLLSPTLTSRTGLSQLQFNACNWNVATNANWAIVDSSMCVLGQANTFTGANTFNGPIAMGFGSQLEFNNSSGNQSVNLQGPGSTSGVTFTLPSADGSPSQVLSTNGSGVLSFISQAGNISTLGVTTGASSGFGFVASSPTAVVNAEGTQFNVNLKGGGTAYLSLNVSSATLQGNNFNQASQLVKLDSSGRLPIVDGSQLTNITFGTNYAQSFTSTNSVILNHKAGTNNLIVQCYDNSNPPNQIGYNSLQLTNTSSATVTFTNNQSGTCIVASTGGGGDNLGNGSSSTTTWTGGQTFSSATINLLTVLGQTGGSFSSKGYVNEVIISSVPDSSPISTVSGNLITVGTVTVTAGCWSFDNVVETKATNASTTISSTILNFSKSNGNFCSGCTPSQNANGEINLEIDVGATAGAQGNNHGLAVTAPTTHVCVNNSQTYYLMVDPLFATSTASVAGGITARREW